MWIRKVLNKSNPFLFLYLLFLIIGGIAIFMAEKETLHLEFNRLHTPLLDTFFKYYTYTGHGLFIIIITFLLLFIKYRYAIFLALAGTLTGLVTQFLKRFVFDEALRPGAYFKDLSSLYTIPDVELHHHLSFPSGHTSSVFCLFLVLSFIGNNRILNSVFFFMALLSGFSRVYLSQHFFEDIYAGSAVGVLMTLLTFVIMDWYKELYSKNWMEQSLIRASKEAS